MEPGSDTRSEEYYRFALGLHDASAARPLTKDVETEFKRCISIAFGEAEHDWPIGRTGTMSIVRVGAGGQLEQQFALTTMGALGFATHATIRTNEGPFFIPAHLCRHVACFLGLAVLYYSAIKSQPIGRLQTEISFNGGAGLFNGIPTLAALLQGSDLFEPRLVHVSAPAATTVEVTVKALSIERFQAYLTTGVDPMPETRKLGTGYHSLTGNCQRFLPSAY